MQSIAIEDVDNFPWPAAVIRRLTEPLGLEQLAINYYELEPGDSFAFAYHTHDHQEEVFVVLEGAVVFDTDDGEVPVAAGEAASFSPGEFQRGWNRGDDRVTAFVLGAPLEYGDEPRLRDCPTCGEMTHTDLNLTEDGTAVIGSCAECETVTGEWSEGSMPGEVP